MSKSKKIIWIDDNPARKRTADDIDAKFVDVRDEDVAQEAESLLKGPQPALVILDHILDKATPKKRLFQRGSTIAEAIKERWPSCPVVGVTSADNVDDIDVRTQGTYDALFSFQEFHKYIDRINAIRKGFALIKRTHVSTARKLVQLLKPPKEETDRLVAALPDDLKQLFREPSVASRLYRWVDRLMDRPGFLYNSLWAATTLGLTEPGFQKVAALFEKGQYAGVFTRNDDPRWWSNRLCELLYRECKPDTGEMSWHVGRRLPGIKKEHHSRCHKCGEQFPDTVAYLDRESSDQFAMHLKCTVLHPRYQRELYFEDIRMMQG